MTFVTIAGRSVSLDQVTGVEMTGAGEAAQLLVASPAGWLKLSGPHAVALHGKLLGVTRTNDLAEGTGVELGGPGDGGRALEA